MKKSSALKIACLVIGVLVTLAFASSIMAADPVPAPAPPAFTPFPTYGIELTQAFTSGQTVYTLRLYSGAYVLYNNTQYQITQLWGFYAVNKTGNNANNITASGSDIGGWKWNQSPNNGTSLDVAGWINQPKQEAMITPVTGFTDKQFTYSQFSFTGQAPLLGAHVTVDIPNGKSSPFGGGNTGNIIPAAVPEPASILALLYGFGGIILRRKR